MGELTCCIFCSDGRQRLGYRLKERLAQPCASFTHEGFDLAENLLDEPTTVRLCTPATLSGHTIIASLQFDPLSMSMVSAG